VRKGKERSQKGRETAVQSAFDFVSGNFEGESLANPGAYEETKPD
jgi:hypothetical protein